MDKKTPQQLASDYKKDSPSIRAGFVKAMKLFAEAENIPQNIKQIALDCINIISGITDYNEKTQTLGEEPELPKAPEPKAPTQPKSANWRFRRGG